MSIRKFINLTLSTFFYIGYLPLVPGTFGSLAGLFIFYFLKDNITLYCLAISILILIGFKVCGPAERIINNKDSRYIVIDEVCGMLLSLIFIPYDIKLIILAFFLFRLLDTLKPYPAGLLQNLKGSAGIMADDIVAGLYTNLILQVVIRFTTLTGS